MSKMDSMAIMLRSLRLPAIQREYANMAKQGVAEEWSFEQYLKILLELEMTERSERRVERLLKRSLVPIIQEVFMGYTKADLMEKL